MERKNNILFHPKSSVEIPERIKGILYSIFIKPINPNNPLYNNLLTGDTYTIEYLASRIGVKKKDVLDIFKMLRGCQIVDNSLLVIKNRKDFEDSIRNLYSLVPKEEIESLNNQLSGERNKKNIFKFSSFDYLKVKEILYLNLIYKYNPDLEEGFSILKPRIPNYVLTKKHLHLSKDRRVQLIKKCLENGLVEKTGGGKFRFVKFDFLIEEFLKNL